MDRIYPQPGLVKDSVLDKVQTALQSNDVETRYLGQSRINQGNWHRAPEVIVGDMPDLVSQGMTSQYDRFELVEYVLGKRKKYPGFADWAVKEQGKIMRNLGASRHEASRSKELLQYLDTLRRHFGEANVVAKNYFLQSFLGETDGILSEAASKEKLYRLILGDNYDNKVINRLFNGYMDAIPENQKKAVLGHIVASIGSSGEKVSRGKSAKLVLESLGPFGVKAAQFIRTNGLAPDDVLRELDTFLDDALKPMRGQIFTDMKKVFGKELKGVVLEDLAGSGSVNYVAKVKVIRHGKDPLYAAVRIQRPNIAGVVENENAIWEKVVKDMIDDPDMDIKDLAMGLDEIRRGAHDTLKPGGVELDQRIERASRADMARSYERFFPDSGIRVEVVDTIDELQKRVPAELQGEISFFEYVDGQTVHKIKDRAVREEVSRIVADTELRAMFENGVFDPDGHPGNWIYDEKNKRLVRIDYAQAQTLTEAERNSFKTIYRALLAPEITDEAVDTIHANLSTMFELEEGVQIDRETVRKILQNRKYPSFSQPSKRLFALQKGLEQALKEKGVADAKVVLTSPMRNTLGSLGRVSTYAEHMGSLNFYRLVADHVDLDISRSRGAIAMEAVKRAVREPARTFQEVKAGFKAKVMPGCFELLSEVVN